MCYAYGCRSGNGGDKHNLQDEEADDGGEEETIRYAGGYSNDLISDRYNSEEKYAEKREYDETVEDNDGGSICTLPKLAC